MIAAEKKRELLWASASTSTAATAAAPTMSLKGEEEQQQQHSRHHHQATTLTENMKCHGSNSLGNSNGAADTTTATTTVNNNNTSSSTCSNNMIDNSRNVYIPVRLRLPPPLRSTSRDGHFRPNTNGCGGGCGGDWGWGWDRGASCWGARNNNHGGAGGFVIAMCRPDVLIHCPLVLQDLCFDVRDCLDLLPASVHPLIRRTRLWVNLSYAFGPLTNNQARFLTHTTTHHHEGWLHWAHDRTDKTLGIEIYSARDYRRMRLHWNGCGLLLHEYSHLCHQLALSDGLENALVQKAYALAQLSGLYDCVRRRDWAGLEKDFDLAYAMVNGKEFFAEMSVTYWSQFYDDDYGCNDDDDNNNNNNQDRTLDRQDPHQILLCSPPFMEPNVMARIEKIMIEQKNKNRAEKQEEEEDGVNINLSSALDTVVVESTSEPSFLVPPPQPKHHEDSSSSKVSSTRTAITNPHSIPFFLQLFNRGGENTNIIQTTRQYQSLQSQHCNKFYPFTRGQLRYYDMATFEIMQKLWDEIAQWDDPWKGQEGGGLGRGSDMYGDDNDKFCGCDGKAKDTSVCSTSFMSLFRHTAKYQSFGDEKSTSTTKNNIIINNNDDTHHYHDPRSDGDTKSCADTVDF